MQLTTPIEIPSSAVRISPSDRLLFVGSCFADNIGRRFADNAFQATVNPYGVMYNPISVLHTLQKIADNDCSEQGFPYDKIIITLGTNHIYREKATGEVVDNCQKRPQKLFQEEVLGIDECAATLIQCLEICKDKDVIFTVSPIRYKKYGFHESQLSKSTLLLAIDKIGANYFPAYEIVLDELRDYRFYAPDMIHQSEQAVDYIFERFRETYFSAEEVKLYADYQPIKPALNHKPFNPDSAEYKAFIENAKQKLEEFKKTHLTQ